MPELPEVETIRRQLAPGVIGKKIVAADAYNSPKFSDALASVGFEICNVLRRGKYLILPLVLPTLELPTHELIIHLGMTGRFEHLDTPTRSSDNEPLVGAASHDTHLRAWWTFDDESTLFFHDIRRFGRIAVVPAGEYSLLPTLDALGPEPFASEFTPQYVFDTLKSSRKSIKARLMDQTLVSGLGNIYVDESLFAAGIHPKNVRVTRDQAEKLVPAIVAILQKSIDRGGTTLRNYVDNQGRIGENQRFIECYGRGGQPCRRCESTLQSAEITGRTSTWCQQCQPRKYWKK